MHCHWSAERENKMFRNILSAGRAGLSGLRQPGTGGVALRRTFQQQRQRHNYSKAVEVSGEASLMESAVIPFRRMLGLLKSPPSGIPLRPIANPPALPATPPTAASADFSAEHWRVAIARPRVCCKQCSHVDIGTNIAIAFPRHLFVPFFSSPSSS